LSKNFKDQRLFERLSVRFPVRLVNENFGNCENTVVRDISGQGVRIHTSKRLSVFDKLSLSFDMPRSSSSIDVDGHVVWSSSESNDSCHAGVRFNCPNLMETAAILKAFQ